MIPIVIDSNILFSALYNNEGIERKILDFASESGEIHLFAPDIFWEEIRRNLHIKLGFELEEINSIISDFHVIEVPFQRYKSNIVKAKELTIHENDIPFLAVSLLLNCPIWSGNEKHFKHLLKSKELIWLNSRNLLEFLRKKGLTV